MTIIFAKFNQTAAEQAMNWKYVLTVQSQKARTPLSPFFGRARWLMAVANDGRGLQMIPNRDLTARFVVDQIIRLTPQTVICGYIDPKSAALLLKAGIDLRLGPCSVPASELIQSAVTLPIPPFAGLAVPGRRS